MSSFEENIDKKFLIDAISNYDFYTKKQRDVLCAIAQTSVDGICKVSIAFISQKTGVSRTSVYKALTRFSQEGDIEFDDHSNSRIRMIKLNLKSMQNIISTHLSKNDL